MTVTIAPIAPSIGGELVGLNGRDLIDPSSTTRWMAALAQFGVLVFLEVNVTDDRTSRVQSNAWRGCRRSNRGAQAPRRYRRSPWIQSGRMPFWPGIAKETSCGILTVPLMNSPRRQPSSPHARSTSPEEIPSSPARMPLMKRCQRVRRSRSPTCRSSTASLMRSTSPILNTSGSERAGWDRVPTRVHPLVWIHRDGRRSLVLGATATEVVGWPYDKGRALLDRLLDWSTQTEFKLRHHWRQGDLVIWDNTGIADRALIPTHVTTAHASHDARR